jgi:hypothetical protein
MCGYVTMALTVCAVVASQVSAEPKGVGKLLGFPPSRLCFAGSPLSLSQSPGHAARVCVQPPGRARTSGRRQGLVMQQMGKKPGEFDLVSGKDFDLLALKSFRREAKLRYSNLNQSEPLRIFIFGTLAIIAAAAGIFDIFGELDAKDKAISAATTVLSFSLFLRERSRRTAQLVRMDRECAISDLGVSFTDGMTGATNRFEVRQLRNKLRLLVVYGDRDTLRRTVVEAAVYRRRFAQSEVAFLAVSSDGSTKADWGVPENARGGWLWEPVNAQEWRDYLEEILATKRDAAGKGAWLTLNKKGRSRGSGLGAPRSRFVWICHCAVANICCLMRVHL